MGILSSLWNDIAGPSDTEEAIIDAVCAAVMHDEVLTDDEIAYTIEFVTAMLGVGATEAAQIVEGSINRTESLGIDALLESIAARVDDNNERETALIVAMAATASDGDINHEERAFVASLSAAMDLTSDQFNTAVAKATQLIQDSSSEV